MENRRFRAVEIFWLGVVQYSSGEGHRAATSISNGKGDPGAKAVITSVRFLDQHASLGHFAVAVAPRFEMLTQGLPVGRGNANAKDFGGLAG